MDVTNPRAVMQKIARGFADDAQGLLEVAAAHEARDREFALVMDPGPGLRRCREANIQKGQEARVKAERLMECATAALLAIDALEFAEVQSSVFQNFRRILRERRDASRAGA